MLFLYNHIELIIGSSTMSQVFCGRRNAKQRRIGVYLDGLAIRKELQDAEPTITTIAFPSSTQDLYVEHHLMYCFANSVFVITISHRILEITWFACMSAKHQSNVLARKHQFIPNFLAIVARLDLIILIVSAFSRTMT